MSHQYLDPVYIHLKKKSFIESSFKKDSMGAYTTKAIRQNYEQAAKDLEDRGISQFGDNVSKQEAEDILEEYKSLFIKKQQEDAFKKIEVSLAKTVNSFTYGDNQKLTGKKQTAGGVLNDIASYLNALNDLIAEYNKIDEALLGYLNSKKGNDEKELVPPKEGLFSLSKAETGRGAKAFENIVNLRDTIKRQGGAALNNKSIVEAIEKQMPGWLNILKGDVEEGIDALVAETMFNFTKELKNELKGVATITGEDKILMDEGRARDFIRKFGPAAKDFNAGYTGFTAKTDFVTAFYDKNGKEMGLVGNSIKSYRMKKGKNVTLSGTTVLNATAVTDLIETPFDYLYLNNLVHNSGKMFNAAGSSNILNRYLASKLSIFILAGYAGKAAVVPMFLTYLNKILYLPDILKQGALKRNAVELFITVHGNKSEIESANKLVEVENTSDDEDAMTRSKKAVSALRKIKISGGFRGNKL